MDSVFYQVSKLHICINFSTGDLKDPPTPLSDSSSSVISGRTTPFSSHNIYQKDSSVKNSTQFQSSKNFPDNSIDFGGTNLM